PQPRGCRGPSTSLPARAVVGRRLARFRSSQTRLDRRPQARLVAATASRLVRFPIISDSPRRRGGVSARTISDHFRLASSPRRRLGSYDHLRSFQTRLVAATASRLVRPSPVMSDPPRRRGGVSARTTISDHFRLASSPRRRLGSYYHSSRDSTGRPARRLSQVLIRAITKRTARLSRVRTRNRMKLPPESTFRTASYIPNNLRGCMKRSKKTGS